MFTVHVQDHIDASPEEVFDLLADHESYARFSTVSAARLLRPGDRERNGEGAVRELRANGAAFRERITRFERPYLLEYLVLHYSLPFAHRGGSIRLTPSPSGGTSLDWTSRFDVPLPMFAELVGRGYHWGLTRGFRTILAELKRDLAARSPAAPWLIYGANGYAGALVARAAKARGERPILAGRDARALGELGRELDLPVRVFGLERRAELERGLRGVHTVLSCAGPFRDTSEALLAACLEVGANYLDISGELDALEAVLARADACECAGIVALPGVGFDVVATDCLAALLLAEMPDATRLRLAFKSSHGRVGPGTAKVMFEALVGGARVRRQGKVVALSEHELLSEFAFERAPEPALAVSWGDVATAHRSTGIPNIECFVGVDALAAQGLTLLPRAKSWLGEPRVRGFIERQLLARVRGPNAKQRRDGRMFVIGELSGPIGTLCKRMVLKDGPDFTADAAVECTLRVRQGDVRPGATTPALAFGAELLEALSGVSVESLSRPERPRMSERATQGATLRHGI